MPASNGNKHGKNTSKTRSSFSVEIVSHIFCSEYQIYQVPMLHVVSDLYLSTLCKFSWTSLPVQRYAIHATCFGLMNEGTSR